MLRHVARTGTMKYLEIRVGPFYNFDNWVQYFLLCRV